VIDAFLLILKLKFPPEKPHFIGHHVEIIGKNEDLVCKNVGM